MPGVEHTSNRTAKVDVNTTNTNTNTTAAAPQEKPKTDDTNINLVSLILIIVVLSVGCLIMFIIYCTLTRECTSNNLWIRDSTGWYCIVSLIIAALAGATCIHYACSS